MWGKEEKLHQHCTETCLCSWLLWKARGAVNKGPWAVLWVYVWLTLEKMLILLLDRKICGRHMFAAIVLCQLCWQKPLTHRNTSSSQPRRGSPSEQSSKMQIWGIIQKGGSYGQPSCVPAMHHCLPWPALPAAVEKSGAFCILLKPHNTELGYMR